MDNLNKPTFEDLIEINEWIKEMDHLSLEFKERLKKEKLKNEINYLNARDGKLEMRTEDGVRHFGQTVEQISKVIQENGVYENLMGGSSLDFASEFGFKNDDDALSLWDDALIHSAKEESLS